MEGDTSRPQATPTPQTTMPPVKPEGGVAFDTPKSASEVEREGKTPAVSLEEVDRELTKAGVTPGDDTPSWLADKKSALASQTAPIITPRPQPTATPPVKKEGGTEIEDIKKKTYSDILRPLRTYKDDIARAIQRNKVSRTDISVAEQQRSLGRMEEERGQLELKEKIEQDRERLEMLKRPQKNDLIVAEEPVNVAPEAPEPPTEEKEGEQHVLHVEPEPVTKERVTVSKQDTYEVGELAQQAATMRGDVSPQKNTGSPHLDKPSAEKTPDREVASSLQSKEAELTRRTEFTRESRPVQIPERPTASKTMKLILGSFALLILGAGALGATLYIYRDTPTPLSPLETDTLVFAEQSQEIPVGTVNGNAFLGLLTTRTTGINAPLNAITDLKLTVPSAERKVRQISTQEFFEKAQTGASSALIRAFHPKFMLGVHSFEGSEAFLVFKTSFYENSFSGMLAWEARMSQDLAPLFGSALMRDIETATTTTNVSGVFKDRLINNIDTRILLDLNGETRLIYSFIDRQTLVITTNRDTFLEVVSRLNSTRVER